MEDRSRKGLKHEVMVVDREVMQVTGVKDVESFDSEEFLLNTEFGYLHIRGQNLHIKNLNLEQGFVAIEGLVYEMGYLNDGYSSEKAKGFFGKLFK
ncbi:sporulation protein YabP [Tepidibacillus infernus]|uniref:Sporulation protein YabP n=1 Tax=Tepidibacillus decaturensis TaxID=1413211 RepID=A0A135L7G4_9BACI|nr:MULTISPECIES: sporulation protein YabP [Tepidibacillus]KXG44847.1 sporulation protein YabP [Tepidibacillus decaturensis]GBF11393.1 spore protein YabP [Tepidibacillus sp. HK-1]